GQAEALAAAMTDTLATKQDLQELRVGIDARFGQVDARLEHFARHLATRLVELENRIDIRFREHTAMFRGELADLERRMTMRLGGVMVAGIVVCSAPGAGVWSVSTRLC